MDAFIEALARVKARYDVDDDEFVRTQAALFHTYRWYEVDGTGL